MNKLVNQEGTPKPVGATSSLYNSRNYNLKEGETVEVENSKGEIINIAVVTKIDGNQACIEIVS